MNRYQKVTSQPHFEYRLLFVTEVVKHACANRGPDSRAPCTRVLTDRTAQMNHGQMSSIGDLIIAR